MKQKQERREKIIKAYSCKKIVYENCRMVAPDGELLATCDSKKALWYIDKGLAKSINESPLTIMLNFEPSGRKTENKNDFNELYEDHFITGDRENRCVVCGKEDDYSRYHVVPSLYRQ